LLGVEAYDDLFVASDNAPPLFLFFNGRRGRGLDLPDDWMVPTPV
jgi:hypothetical protein